MNNKKIQANAFLSTFGANLFIQGCTVLQAILLARMLGPSGRGEFATIILWPNLFAGVGILGVNMAIARFAGQGIDTGNLMRSAVKLTMITGTSTALLCYFLLPVLLPDDKQMLLPISYVYLLSIPLNHLSWSIQGIDHGSGNFNWLNFTRMLIYPVYFLGLVICWYFAEDKVYGVTLALLVGIGSSLIFRLIAYLTRGYSTSPGPGLAKIMKAGIPFSAASILIVFYDQMDKALLVWLLSTEEIGWYVAAFAAAGGVNIICRSLGTVQFTASAQTAPGYGFGHLAALLRKGMVVSLLGGGAFAIVLPWLLPVVYGSAFKPAIPVALILLPGVLLAGWGEILNMALRGQGRPVAGVVFKSLGLVVMGLIGYGLGQKYGGEGIAVGYVVGEMISTFGVLIVVLRIYNDVELKKLQPTLNDITFIFKLLPTRRKK